jgi:hypothetical protein
MGLEESPAAEQLIAEMNEGPHGAPYPPSSLVDKITWHWETLQSAAEGSDLWPTTWGPDDHLYAAWGDGGGFGGSDTDGRVSLGFARIQGKPEHFHGVNLNGGKNSEHPASFPKKGKTDGLLYDHGILYTSINLQDGAWPDVNHVLAWSRDKAATWTQADWFFGKGPGAFEPAKFLAFGKDGSGVPSNLAGYIYLLGPKYETTATGRGTSLFLARAPRKRITQKNAMEFFAGTEKKDKPVWRQDFAEAQPVFTDTNGVAPGSIVYNRALKRYLLACFHPGPGQLGVFEGVHPWGPWRTIGYYQDWGNMGAVGHGLSCEFPAKWMSEDGLTLWTVFTVYGDGAKQGIKAHDRFNLLKATLTLKDKDLQRAGMVTSKALKMNPGQTGAGLK